jgi:DNA-binding beta-propeller fold protein YncE
MMRALAILIIVFIASCVPSKARIDYTLSESIIWPGAPEKPRIKYLWSLRRVSGQESAGKFVRVLTGEDEFDVLVPQASNFLVSPHGVFVDDKEVLYITDPGASRVSVIDLKTMNSFNIESAGEVSLLSPIGVVAAPDGRIYVSDADLKKVAVFNKKGKFISFFEGQFNRPTGLAINPREGRIYVADTWAHLIYIYGLDGKRLDSIGGRGEEQGKLNYPTHLFVDKDGLLYVSDTLNFRVQIFTPTGKFLTAFGLIGDSYSTFDKIKGVAVDTEGHIYVVDAAQDMVKIYDRQGRLLLFFGRKGHFYGDFYLPAGIYIDTTDRIYVADSLNRRIQVFQFLGGD